MSTENVYLHDTRRASCKKASIKSGGQTIWNKCECGIVFILFAAVKQKRVQNGLKRRGLDSRPDQAQRARGPTRRWKPRTTDGRAACSPRDKGVRKESRGAKKNSVLEGPAANVARTWEGILR